MKTSTPLLSKMLIAMLCCLLTTTGYSQSKEETITWLKEKLSQSLVGDLKIKDINIENFTECEFVLTYKYVGSDGSVGNYRITVPTKGLALNERGRFLFDHKAIMQEIWYNNKTTGPAVDKNYREYNSDVEVADRETDLHNRIVKAFKHLSTFCPQKKETF